MICLDTNAVIVILNKRAPLVRQRLDSALMARESVSISSIVLCELWVGAKKSASPSRNTARLRNFLSGSIAVLTFDSDDAEEAGDIRATLERAGTPIGPYDILIAAQARRRGATLVTANTREFARVPGLTLEDWTRP